MKTALSAVLLFSALFTLSAQATDLANVEAQPDTDAPGSVQKERLDKLIDALENQPFTPDHPHRYVIADEQGHVIGVNAKYVSVTSSAPGEVYLSDIVNVMPVKASADIDHATTAIRIGSAR